MLYTPKNMQATLKVSIQSFQKCQWPKTNKMLSKTSNWCTPPSCQWIKLTRFNNRLKVRSKSNLKANNWGPKTSKRASAAFSNWVATHKWVAYKVWYNNSISGKVRWKDIQRDQVSLLALRVSRSWIGLRSLLGMRICILLSNLDRAYTPLWTANGNRKYTNSLTINTNGEAYNYSSEYG